MRMTHRARLLSIALIASVMVASLSPLPPVAVAASGAGAGAIGSGPSLPSLAQVLDVFGKILMRPFLALSTESWDAALEKAGLPSRGATGGVDTYSGLFRIAAGDMVLGGRGPSIAFARTYNSLDTVDGPLGPGWTHTYNMRIVQNGGGQLAVVGADGRRDVYTSLGGGAFSSPSGVVSVLSQNVGTGVYTVTNPDQSTATFDADGKLTALTDRFGNTSTMTYSSGKLVSVSSPDGRGSLTLAYDPTSGKLTSITDWADTPNTVTFTYDSNTPKRLWKVTDREGEITEYAYSGTSSRLTSITNANANVVLTMTYDGSNRVATQKDARGLTSGEQVIYSYVTNGDGTKTTTVTFPPTSYQPGFDPQFVDTHNTSGQLTSRVTKPVSGGGEDATTSFTYNGNGFRDSVTDPRGFQTLFCFDVNLAGSSAGSRGNLTRVIAPAPESGDNKVVSLSTYDNTNNLTQSVSPRGVTTTTSTSCSTNLSSSIDSDFATDHTYDGTKVFLLSTTVHYTDPDLGAKSAITKFEYDSNFPGQLSKAIPPRGNTGGSPNYDYATSYSYYAASDANNRDGLLASVTTPAATTSYDYDEIGRQINMTDANGEVWEYEYDLENRLLESRAPEPETGVGQLVTEHEYDAVGHVVATTNAEGVITRFEFDEREMLEAVFQSATEDDPDNDADPIVTRYEYDDAGHRVREIRADNEADERATDYASDGLGRLRSETLYPSWPTTTPTLVTEYTYDLNGNTLTVEDAKSQTTTFTYDRLNRLLEIDYSDAETDDVEYRYDANGNRTVMDGALRVDYLYDELNRVLQIETEDGDNDPRVRYRYDLDGHRDRMIYPDDDEVTYTFDTAGRMVTVSDWDDKVTSYEYRADGRLLEVHHVNGTTTEYAYDDTGRMTEIWHKLGAATISRHTLTLDRVGNRTAVDDVLPIIGVPLPLLTAQGPGGIPALASQPDPIESVRTLAVAAPSGADGFGSPGVAMLAAAPGEQGQGMAAVGRGEMALDAPLADVRAVPLADSGNLVANPGFESNTNNWSVTNASLSRDTGNAHSGSAGGKVQRSGGSTGTLTDNPDTVSNPAQNTVYSGSVWVKGYAASAGKTITLSLTEKGGAVANESDSSSIALSTSWQQISVNRTIQESDRSKLEISLHVPSWGSGDGFWVDDISIIERSAPPPAQPTSLVATATADLGMELEWNDAASGESGYEVQRKSEDNAAWITLTSSLAANTETYTDTGLSETTEYTYRVRALHSAGHSRYSAEASDETPQDANLLVNPGFEDGVSNWATPNSDLEQIAGGHSGAYAGRAHRVSGGGSSGGIDDSPNSVQQPQKDRVYAASAWVKGYNGGEGKTLTLRINEQGGATADQSSQASVTLTSSWQHVTVQHTVLQVDRSSLDMSLTVTGWSSSQGFYVDDAVLELVESSRLETIEYTYDKLDRLTEVDAPGTVRDTTYAFDAVGNRVSMVRNSVTTNSTFDKADRVLTVGATSYTTDANGNVTAKGAATFEYDQANRLVEGITLASKHVHYRYDGDGQRVQSWCCNDEPPLEIYDGLGPTAPLLMSDDTKFVYGADGLAYTHIPSNNRRVVQHRDALGSARAKSDDDGEVVEVYQYDEYGVEIARKGENIDPFGFKARKKDLDTGLNLMGYRDYDPAVGRFLQRDPARSGGNHFVYANNNPTSQTDPTGLECEELDKDPCEDPIDAVEIGPDMDTCDDCEEVEAYEVDVSGASNSTEGSEPEPVVIVVSRSSYPEAADHIEDAQAAGQPSVLTIERTGSGARGRAAMRASGLPPRSDSQRDEYPPKMFAEGGAGASVRYIDSHDNQGAGSVIGSQTSKLPNGTKVRIVVGP